MEGTVTISVTEFERLREIESKTPCMKVYFEAGIGEVYREMPYSVHKLDEVVSHLVKQNEDLSSKLGNDESLKRGISKYEKMTKDLVETNNDLRTKLATASEKMQKLRLAPLFDRVFKWSSF